MHTKKQHAILLLPLFLILYIWPLGIRDLTVPDETRYAEIPREMIAGGDWVVPHLNGLRYFEKPVLGYWVYAGSILLCGENNFAVRLPSAMAVGLSALLVFMLVYRTSRNNTRKDAFPAILAVLIFLSCFEVFGVGNTAVLDNLFSFFLTATITAFYFATEEKRGSARERRFLLLAGLSCGLAFLTKGFLAFAVPFLALVPYLVWQRRYFDLFRMSLLPILTAVLVALPWSILIYIREPDFWHFFFWNEHIRRFMADNAQHKESLWLFFLTVPGMFLPWVFLVPAAAPGIKEQLNGESPQGRLIKLSLCWLILPFLFISFSKGKLLTYILPCFPPFAILMTFGLLHLLNKKGRESLIQRGITASTVFFVFILLAFLYLQFVGYNRFRPYHHPWKTVMAVTGLLFYVLLCGWAHINRKGREKLLLFGMAPLFLFSIAPFLIPDPTDVTASPGPFIKQYKRCIDADDVIISDENTVGAVGWYLQRSNIYVLGRAGELAYGLSYKDADGRLLDMQSAVDLINRNRGDAVVIARMKRYERWRDQLPKPVFQNESGPGGYMFWKY